MKTLIASIIGTSRYSQSRPHGLTKDADETHEDFDRRIYREHLHYDADGIVYIPPSAWKNCLDDSARFLGLKIKGNATYTKHFEAGVQVFEPTPLGIHKDDVPFERLYMNLDGKRGSGSRGFRHYPYIEKDWRVDVPFVIIDETVLQRYSGDQSISVFEHVLRNAGQLIGIGRFRPRNRGYYGRFAIEKIVEAAEEEFLMAAE